MDPTNIERLRASFDAPGPLTVGIEEELMLLDSATLDLAPRAEEVLAAAPGDQRFKLELPAAQLELVTLPCHTVGEAAAQLLAARAALQDAARGIGRLAAAGAHPLTAPQGLLNHHERYRRTREEFGPVAHAQLVFGLHVHVRVSGAERAVAVHNALRSYLPQLGALAANAPFHAGRDTGLASVRPKISELLPRQGVPPVIEDLDELAEAWRWGAAAGSLPRPSQWWWELRLHPTLGTIEVRVPDQQTTVAESAAVAAAIHALVAGLVEDYDDGVPLTVHPTWRIAENRWSAGRHGLAGTLADLETGHGTRATRCASCLTGSRRPQAGWAVPRSWRPRNGWWPRTAPSASGTWAKRTVWKRSWSGWPTASSPPAREIERLRTTSPGQRVAMRTVPAPRGPVSEALFGELARPPHPLPPIAVAPSADPVADDDLQLALYCCYELFYRGLPGVDERWEWEPSLLALRGELEAVFEDDVREAAGSGPPPPRPEDADRALRAIADADDGPSLSLYLARHGSAGEMLEFLMHRSAYQLKEADPHSWAIPRLSGGPKAALVEVQADEYGGGRPERVHAQLFADTMEAVGLDPSYGAYVDRLPAVTLATVNLMSLFGLHRRNRGAIVGHLALFEMTSSVPSRRYAEGLRRLGHGDRAAEFFDEHVEADAVHENIAAVDLAGGLMRQEPEVAGDVLFGARALLYVEGRWARHLLESWEAGRSSLRLPLAEPIPA